MALPTIDALRDAFSVPDGPAPSVIDLSTWEDIWSAYNPTTSPYSYVSGGVLYSNGWGLTTKGYGSAGHLYTFADSYSLIKFKRGSFNYAANYLLNYWTQGGGGQPANSSFYYAEVNVLGTTANGAPRNLHVEIQTYDASGVFQRFWNGDFSLGTPYDLDTIWWKLDCRGGEISFKTSADSTDGTEATGTWVTYLSLPGYGGDPNWGNYPYFNGNGPIGNTDDWQFDQFGPPPPCGSDAFADAAPIAFPSVINCDNTGATNEAGEPFGADYATLLASTLWWKFTAADTGIAHIRMSLTGQGLVVYRDTDGTLAGLVQVNESYMQYQSGTSNSPDAYFFVCKGSTYYVQVGQYTGTPGPFSMTTEFRARAITSGWISTGWLESNALLHGDACQTGWLVTGYLDMMQTQFEDLPLMGEGNHPWGVGLIAGVPYHFGSNASGVKGDGTVSTIYTDTTGATAIPGLTNIVAVKGHWNGAWFLDGSGNLYQVGSGFGAHYTAYVQKTNVIKFGGQGSGYAVCQTGDGKIWAIGSNAAVNWGLSWVDITGACPPTVRDITCGYQSLYVVMQDDSVWALGLNSSGQLGLGDTANRSVLTLTGRNAHEIVAGYDTAYWIESGGAVSFTGRNSDGGSAFVSLGNHPLPTPLTWLPPVKKLITHPAGDGGQSTGMALCLNGELWSWGPREELNGTENPQYPYGSGVPSRGIAPGYLGTDWAVDGDEFISGLPPYRLGVPSDWTVLDIAGAEHCCAMKVVVGAVAPTGRAPQMAQIVG